MSLIPRLGRGLFDESLWDFADPFGMLGMSGSMLPVTDTRIEGATRAWTPRLDLSETENEYKVSCDLPGLTKVSALSSIHQPIHGARTLTAPFK